MNKIPEQQISDDKNSTKVKSEESTKKNGNNDVKKPEEVEFVTPGGFLDSQGTRGPGIKGNITKNGPVDHPVLNSRLNAKNFRSRYKHYHWCRAVVGCSE